MRHSLRWLPAQGEKSLLLSTGWVVHLAHLIGKDGKCPLKIGWDLLEYLLFINTVNIYTKPMLLCALAWLPQGRVIALTLCWGC